jgi:tRNA(fMet)-specific endonuclease VapC
MLLSMLDTNLCIRALRDRPAYIRARLEQEAESLCISTIILYELYVGAERSARPEYQKQVVNAFVARLEILEFDVDASRHAANIRADLTSRGQLIGSNDLLIAGHARSLGLKLITGNLGEFTRVDGLLCEDWLDDNRL